MHLFTSPPGSESAIRSFNAWLADLGAPVVLTPGNHESFLEGDPRKRSLPSNATVLINESVEIFGLKLWGSPVTPLYGGAFGLSNPADRRRLYATIPRDTNILITHGPPLNILDRAPGRNYHRDPEFLEAVQQVRPKLHVFGHIHGAYGRDEVDGTLFINAALLSPDGDLRQKPVVVRMTGRP